MSFPWAQTEGRSGRLPVRRGVRSAGYGELPQEHQARAGGGADVRHRLGQIDGKDLVGEEVGQDIDQRDEKDDLPQQGQEKGDLGSAPGPRRSAGRENCIPSMNMPLK